MKKACIRVGSSIVCICLLFFALDRWIIFRSANSIFYRPDAVPPADAILVPGARIYGGLVSPILAERLDAAIELLHQQKSAAILVSGDYSSRYYDEAAAMSTYLQKRGVDPKYILIDHAGFSTYDSIYRAKNIFDVHSLIITSQDFHLPRALFIADFLGLDAAGFSASRRELRPEETWRQTWREPLARLKAVYDIIRQSPPAFTGSGLPINSKGEVQRR